MSVARQSGDYPGLHEGRGNVPDRLQAGRQRGHVAGLEPDGRSPGDLDGHLTLEHMNRLALRRCPRDWAVDRGEPGQAGPHPAGVDELMHLATRYLRISFPLVG